MDSWMKLVLANACWSSDCDVWTTGNLDCEETWVYMFKHFKDQNISYLFVLCSAYQTFLLLLKECFY